MNAVLNAPFSLKSRQKNCLRLKPVLTDKADDDLLILPRWQHTCPMYQSL
jgi:hypothetical protein